MKNNNNNKNVSNPFWKGIAILIMLIVTVLQSAFGQVSITTSVPDATHLLQVGTIESPFTVYIKNVDIKALILNKLVITPFAGVMIQGNHVVDNKGTNITLSNNEFTFPSNYSLAAGDSLKFTYNATAGCAATGQTGKVQDDIVLSYTQNGQSNTINVKSDSYPILYPQFTVATKSLEVTSGNTYDLITEVSNATGAGNAEEMQLTVTFPAGTDVVATAPVLVSGSTTVSGMSLPSVVNGSSVTYTLNKGVIESMGFTAGTKFFIKQPIKVNSYFDSRQIQYSVSQKVDGMVCNSSKSSGTYTLTQGVADPQLIVTIDKVIKQIKICDTTGIVQIKFKNNSTHSMSGAAIIANLSVKSNNLQIDGINSITGMQIPFSQTNQGTTLQAQSGVDYDGIGGFGDYNNDGNYLDLNAGDSAYIILTFRANKAVLFSPFPNMNIESNIAYTGLDNKNYTEDKYLAIDNIDNNSFTLDGTSDVDAGKSYPFAFTSTYYMKSSIFKSPRQYYVMATVPSGFTINNQGTQLLLPVKASEIILHDSTFSAAITIQSTNNSLCGNYSIRWQLLFKETGCNTSDYTIVDTKQKNFYNHTSNGCSNVPNAVLSLDISRVNTGYIGTFYSPVFESDLVGKQRYTEANCPNSTTFIGGDTMRLKLKAIIPANNTCAYKSIIAHFTKSTSIDDLQPFSATLTINANTYTTNNFSTTNQNGVSVLNAIFTFPLGLNIQSTDTVNIMVLSTLPQSVNTNTAINLRGSISTVNCSNDTLQSDSRGNYYKTFSQITVYVENSLSVCSSQSSEFILSASKISFPNEYRPIIAVQEVTITKIPGVQYTFFEVSCNRNLVSNSNYTITPDNTSIHIVFNKKVLLQSGVSQSVQVLANGNTCDVISTSTKYNCTGHVIYSINGIAQSTNSTGNIGTNLPKYSFPSSSISKNDGKIITWNIRVKNDGNDYAPSTMMEWAVASGKSSLQLNSVLIDGVNAPLSTIGNNYYFTLAKNGTTLQPNTAYDLTLTARYTGCAFNDSIFSTLRTAYNCNIITASNFNTYVCDSISQKLNVSTANLSLVPSIPQSPSSFYNFCDSIPYSVDVFLGNTDSSNVSYWMNPLPSNIIIKGNKINYEFDGKTGTISTANVFTPNNQNISKEILGNYFSSVPDWNQKSVKLSFNLSIECSNQLVTDITKVLSENVLRTNICGAEKKESFDFTPKIRGFENLQKISIDAIANGFDASQQGEVSVTTSNVHITIVDSVNVTAILPEGVHYKSTANDTIFQSITSNTDAKNITTVSWAFTRGKYIQGKDSVTFNALFENTNICSTDSAKIIFISSLQRKVLACNKIDSCIATASSDTAIVYLKRTLGNLIGSVTVPTVCQGESFSLNPTSSVPNVTYTYAIVPANKATIVGNTITPTTGFSGDLTITIKGTKETCTNDSTVIVTVKPKQAITITAVNPITIDASAIQLLATPIGGTWSGDGVTGDMFNPAIGVGSHKIYYTYSSVGSCDSKDSITIIVKGDCKIALTVNNEKVCDLKSFNLPITINDLSSCDVCFYNMRFVLEYDNTKLQLNTVSLKNNPNIDMFFNPLSGKVVVQLYQKAGLTSSFIGAGDFIDLNFTPLVIGTSEVKITDAYINGNTIQPSAIGKLSTGTVDVLNPPTVTITSPSTSICTGSDIIITASGASTYLWNNGDSNKVQTVTPIVNTDYNVTGTDSNGCTNTAITTVYVNALPTITATASSSTICLGNQTTIGATGANSYVWNPSDGVVNPIATTTYDVTGTDNNGCKNTSSVTVTVNNLPTIVAVASLPTICIGSQTTLSAIGGNTYVWSPLGGTVSPTSTTSYFVTGTDNNGCSNSSSVTVSVNNMPNIVAVASLPTICSGNQTIVSASGANSYVWSPSAGTVSPTATTTYFVTGTDNGGCSNTASTTVTVNSLPTIIATASIPTICLGNQTLVSATGANSYVWNPSDGNVNPAVTTTYYVTGTDGNGCKNIGSTKVTVNTLPTVIATASSPTICLGKQTTVSATGAISYSWNPSAGTISPIATTTYYVTGTDGNGCKNTATTKVTVNTLPTIVASASIPTICLGKQTTVSATGASSYSWSPLAGNVNPTVTTTYFVTGTDGKGCTNIANTKVTVNTLPTIIATASIPSICLGNQTVVSATGANSYVWSPLAGTVSPTVTTTYYVTGTSTLGCLNTARTTVTVKPLPTISVITGNITSSIGLTATYSVTNQTGVSYTWTVTGGTIQSGQGTNQVSIRFTAMPATISVTASNNGCTSPSASLTVTQSLVAITGNSVICKDNITDNWQSSNYTVTSNNGAATYSWSVGAGASLNNTTGTTVGVNFATGIGVVTLSVTETVGGIVTGIGTLVISKNLRPANMTYQNIGSSLVCSTQQGVQYTVTGTAPSYLWKVPTGDNIVPIQGTTNSILVNFNNVAGNIEVYGQNGAGCLSNSGLYFNVQLSGACPASLALKSYVETTTSNDPTVIQTTVESSNAPILTEITNSVTVIPQPAKNEVRVVSTSPVKTVTMYDMNGKVVISVKNITVIDITTLSSSTYQMIIETEAGVFNRTVVVVK
jgi:hypothetical protein